MLTGSNFHLVTIIYFYISRQVLSTQNTVEKFAFNISGYWQIRPAYLGIIGNFQVGEKFALINYSETDLKVLAAAG